MSANTGPDTTGPTQSQDQDSALLSIIEQAVRDRADLDQLKELIQFRNQIVAEQRKTAFDEALSAMQEDLPVIEKHGEIDRGSGKIQKYALFEDINEAIRPILVQHKFALFFHNDTSDGKIKVTGILSYGGHREETTTELPADVGGSKNTVQAVGSSLTYGKRFVTVALLNLTTRDMPDDDGEAGGGSFISDEDRDALRQKIEDSGADLEKFCEAFKIESLAEMTTANLSRANVMLDQKMRKR